jgi:hypothetical protein
VEGIVTEQDGRHDRHENEMGKTSGGVASERDEFDSILRGAGLHRRGTAALGPSPQEATEPEPK